MTPKAKTRFAIIGAGNRGIGIGTVIARDYASEASLTVVCDVNEAAAQKSRDACHIENVATDYGKAIQRDDVDAVVVSVPPGLHRDVVVAAARAKKHALCEKPFAVEMSH